MTTKGFLSLLRHFATAFAFLSVARALRPDGGDMQLLNSTRRSASLKLEHLISTPSSLFNAILVTLILATVTFNIFERSTQDIKTKAATTTTTRRKPSKVTSLQIRFLVVFWIIRCADWLQGPYFYELYASKVPVSVISKLFLTGFAIAALFGPLLGRAADQFGRKKATIAFTILYACAAASTESSTLAVLFLGRILSGIATSLMFSAPEAWLVAESQQSENDPDRTYLEQTFGMAYAGDSIVAILACQLSTAAASHRGPGGPFELSIVFLVIGGILIALLWRENAAESSDGDEHKPSIKEALQVIRKDPKMILVGTAQSLFEASMYVFIMEWPPTISQAIEKAYGSDAATPYGQILSCFMACCLLGSTLFRHFGKMGIPLEESTSSMLTIAALAMGSASTAASSPEAPLVPLLVALLVFEVCVGMYFPSSGSLRSKYVPDTHRSIIMNLFAIPLNVMVVSVFLASERIGVSGALRTSTAALNLAAFSMYKLYRMAQTNSPVTS